MGGVTVSARGEGVLEDVFEESVSIPPASSLPSAPFIIIDVIVIIEAALVVMDVTPPVVAVAVVLALTA